MSLQFTFSRPSEGHLAISCYDLGLRYEVFGTRRGVVSIQQWDTTKNKNVVVGEFTRSSVWRNRIRVGADAPWVPVREFLYRHGGLWSRSRAFKGHNGSEYVWERRNKGLILHRSFSLDAKPMVLVTFNKKGDLPYLECHDTSLLTCLDRIIVSLLIMEGRIYRL
ncbi:hypothetical protein FRC19_003090 [Serendipita sp. 401]|nr:hypothetical protein FRC19_003090 [Serendipita sp. 401]